MFQPTTHKFSINLSAIDYNNGNTIILNDNVKSIAIHKDYIKNVYPLYNLSLYISEEIQKKLAKTPFYLSLKIFRSTVMNDSEINGKDDSPDSPITDKIIDSILLRPYGKSKLAYNTKKSDLENSSNEKSDVKEQQFVTYSLNCIPLEQLRINNKILNNCYEKANINEIVINSISEVYDSEIYYQESKNINRYDSLLVPQMSLIPILKYLQENYIIYSNMLNIFFENNKLYVYDIKELDRDFENTFTIIMEQDVGSAEQSKYSKILIDENNNIKKTLDMEPILISNKELTNYSYGDSILYNSYDDNFNLVTRSYILSDDLKNFDKKIRVQWNADRFDTFEKRNLSLFTEFSQLTLYDMDSTLINPSTQINIFGSNDADIIGSYALLSEDVYYTSEDKINFNNSIILHLGKK